MHNIRLLQATGPIIFAKPEWAVEVMQMPCPFASLTRNGQREAE